MMLTCADCKEIDCIDIGSDRNACDNFNSEEEVVADKTWGNAVLDNLQQQIDDLKGMCSAQHMLLTEMQRKFDTIIAAVVRASGPEEER